MESKRSNLRERRTESAPSIRGSVKQRFIDQSIINDFNTEMPNITVTTPCKKTSTLLLKKPSGPTYVDIDGIISQLDHVYECILKDKNLKITVRTGDLYPDDMLAHESLHLYVGGIINRRCSHYVLDHPTTNFCFHCDRNLSLSHFRRLICLTDYKSDILFGVPRCKVFRDINLCSECYHTKDLSKKIDLCERAEKIFMAMYH